MSLTLAPQLFVILICILAHLIRIVFLLSLSVYIDLFFYSVLDLVLFFEYYLACRPCTVIYLITWPWLSGVINDYVLQLGLHLGPCPQSHRQCMFRGCRRVHYASECVAIIHWLSENKPIILAQMQLHKIPICVVCKKFGTKSILQVVCKWTEANNIKQDTFPQIQKQDHYLFNFFSKSFKKCISFKVRLKFGNPVS